MKGIKKIYKTNKSTSNMGHKLEGGIVVEI